MARGTFHFHVRPRYTCGSPAQVDERIARTVAGEEAEAYQQALTGIYGEEQRQRALRDGLDGIAYTLTEHPQHWLVEDLITERVSVKPFETFNVARRAIDHEQCARCARYRAQHDGVQIAPPDFGFPVGARVAYYHGRTGVVECSNGRVIRVRFEDGTYVDIAPPAVANLLQRVEGGG